MTTADLTAKARRAACWLPTAFEKLDAGLYADTWTVFQLEDEAKDLWGYLHCDLSDRMMIAFCEDRGWQDQEQEADGVEWELVTERALIGTIEVHVYAVDGLWTWDLLDTANSDNVRCEVASMKPTREEARAAAVEAARALMRNNAEETQQEEE